MYYFLCFLSFIPIWSLAAFPISYFAYKETHDTMESLFSGYVSSLIVVGLTYGYLVTHYDFADGFYDFLKRVSDDGSAQNFFIALLTFVLFVVIIYLIVEHKVVWALKKIVIGIIYLIFFICAGIVMEIINVIMGGEFH